MLSFARFVILMLVASIANAADSNCPSGSKLFKKHATWSECCKDDGSKKCTRNGPFTIYRSAGKPFQIIHYSDGKKDGRFVEFDKLGNQLIKGEFSKNRPSGTWIISGSNGQIIEIHYSVNGIREISIFVNKKKMSYTGGVATLPKPTTPMSGITPSTLPLNDRKANNEKNDISYALFYSDAKESSVVGLAIDFPSTAQYDAQNYRFFPDAVINTDRAKSVDPSISWYAYEKASGLCQVAITGALKSMGGIEEESTYYPWVKCPQYQGILDHYNQENTILYISGDTVFYQSPNGKAKKLKIKSSDAYKAEIIGTKMEGKNLWANIKIAILQVAEEKHIKDDAKNVDSAWIPFYVGSNPILKSRLEDVFAPN